MASRGKKPVTPDLGASAGLGLPLAPEERGHVYKLPATTRELGSTVTVPGSTLPKDITFTSATTQAGRIRITPLIGNPLSWAVGTALVTTKQWVKFGGAGQVPALLLEPAESEASGRLHLSEDGRITIRVDDRLHLGLAANGDVVLALVRLKRPNRLVLLGAGSLTVILDEGRGRAR